MKKITKLLSVALCLAMLMGLAVAVSAATPAEIVDAAYALEPGEEMSEAVTLTGELTEIDDAYSSQYNNISVYLTVEGKEDKPILCYRMVGDGIADLVVGDTITVTGTIIHYTNSSGSYQVVEFKAGCTLDAVVSGGGSAPVAPEDPAEIVDAAYALESGDSLPYTASLTGEIVSIDSEYNDSYGNITVTIAVEGKEDKPIQCFRMTGGSELAVGDVITVTGTLKNWNGTIEFNSGCTYVPYEAPVVPPTNPQEIMDAANALEPGESLPYESTLTGTISEINTDYSEQYQNITVTISVDGTDGESIMCFRMKGDGAADLAVGDKITVTGNITNYNGTVEFNSGCTFVPVVEEAETVNVYVQVPADWADPCLWAWIEGVDNSNVFDAWPGEALTLEGDWYVVSIPNDTNSVIVNANAGAVQTGNLTIETGKDVYIVVTAADNVAISYTEPTEGIPGTGDMNIAALVVAMLAATAGAVVIGKKKEF